MPKAFALIFMIAACALLSCNADYSPKPRGYYRIDLPVRGDYRSIPNGCPYQFSIPNYAIIVDDSTAESKPYWKNVIYQGVNGRLHLSYYPITSQDMFYSLVEDSRRLVFKHTVKADGIDESVISKKEKKVYGLYYTIGGNSASSIQFFLTDSQQHFLRAALYFYAAPQSDSIQPVLQFVQKDIEQMISTFEWK